MTQNIDRRSFLTAAAGGLVVISLGGCTSDTVDGKKRPHYVMVFDQNKCVGCGECKRACNEANHLPQGARVCFCSACRAQTVTTSAFPASSAWIRLA